VNSTLNSAQLHFNNLQQQILRAAVNTIVPADSELNVPGAGDTLIFADIVASIGARHSEINTALTALHETSVQQWQLAFEQLNSVQQLQLVHECQQAMPEQIWSLISVTFECYYRDDRVMQSLDMDARPAFPQGFEVDQGDWSLLDPVKKRAPFYRPT